MGEVDGENAYEAAVPWAKRQKQQFQTPKFRGMESEQKLKKVVDFLKGRENAVVDNEISALVEECPEFLAVVAPCMWNAKDPFWLLWHNKLTWRAKNMVAQGTANTPELHE